jgi:hypothetical protein
VGDRNFDSGIEDEYMTLQISVLPICYSFYCDLCRLIAVRFDLFCLSVTPSQQALHSPGPLVGFFMFIRVRISGQKLDLLATRPIIDFHQGPGPESVSIMVVLAPMTQGRDKSHGIKGAGYRG